MQTYIVMINHPSGIAKNLVVTALDECCATTTVTLFLRKKFPDWEGKCTIKVVDAPFGTIGCLVQ